MESGRAVWSAARGAAGCAAGAALWVLAGCAPHVTEVETPVEPPEAFSAGGEVEAPDRWWTAFDDPVLDRLVERALSDNLDLAAVWERLRAARAVARRQASDLFPDVDAFADASVRRPEDDFGDDGLGDDGFDGDGEELLLGVSAAYEVDLWGGIRSRAQAETYRARATLADYRTAALSLSAEVARTWFQVVEARQQVTLLEEQVEANEKVQRLIENRFGSGQVRGVDVLRQRQLVEATQEQLIAAESRLRVLEHLLAVLLGRPPQAGTGVGAGTVTDALPEPPPLPDTGLPAELVRRRPDVESAFRRLQAADRDLAAAVAERYPRLTLTASVSTGGAGAGDLFDDWTRSLAGGLLAPLLRAGELAAEVERSEAVRRRSLYLYGQTTLLAFQEVEDALVQEASQRRRVASLERQAELTRRAYEQLRLQFFNGLNDYIDVLTALTEAQRVERDLTAARRLLLELRVALYRALAGGFETDRETDREGATATS